MNNQICHNERIKCEFLLLKWFSATLQPLINKLDNISWEKQMSRLLLEMSVSHFEPD